MSLLRLFSLTCLYAVIARLCGKKLIIYIFMCDEKRLLVSYFLNYKLIPTKH